MIPRDSISRRSFLAVAAAASLSCSRTQRKQIPVGLELYSVRSELKDDLMSTVRAVAAMGYEGVEFFSPYFEWTPDYAKDVRRLLDDLGMPCLSTHNSARAFSPENLPHAIELNRILGSEFIIMAGAGKVESLDGWKEVAERINRAAETMRPAGLRAGFHNHHVEFIPLEGERPIDVLAQNTEKEVILQLDVGTCLYAGSDPLDWILKNPGRIVSMHCKDWSPDPDKGFEVLIGEGAAPWKELFEAAERVGGIEHYLVEQEGSRYPPMETAERSLALFHELYG